VSAVSPKPEQSLVAAEGLHWVRAKRIQRQNLRATSPSKTKMTADTIAKDLIIRKVASPRDFFELRSGPVNTPEMHKRPLSGLQKPDVQNIAL